jgi:hypothetical protein
VGRCTAPIHRVLMQDPEEKRGTRLIVRDPAHIALLLGEGVNVDARGVLRSLDRFWDLTPRCVLEYDNQRAAAAAAKEIAGDGTVVETHVHCSRAPQAERGVSVEKVRIDIHYSISGQLANNL